MAHVSLQGLSKVYPGGVTAVEGVELEVEDGEFVVLVGPSGCGKSTTLRMVAGLEEITAGALEIGARLVNEVAGRDRDVAMVFQNYALYPHLTVAQNLAFPLERRRAHGSRLRRLLSGSYRSEARAEDRRIAEEVAAAAETLGIVELLERKPGALSGGQRQRVAVGRALVRRPAVFLFDEPLSNLDAKLRVEMRAELKSLHESLGATMLYVTHDQEEAMTLGDRLVVMADGIVQQCGSPREVYERPSNRFVAGFVGTPGMNFIDAQLVDESGGVRLNVAGESLELPPALARAAGSRRGSVVLGVRPDSVSCNPERVPGALAAQLEQLEDLGDRKDLRLRSNGQVLIARRPGGEEHLLGPCWLSLDLEASHLFESGGRGRRLAAD
jgi:multiple sugar transport system ATP-binding protein